MNPPNFEPMDVTGSSAPRFFNVNEVAIRGFDPVGYFKKSEPVKGTADFASDYLGITFWHASAAHKEIFLSDPARYAPQFGGYCAFAMSKGAVASTQPEAWNIEDVSSVPPAHEVHGDLLYLNYSLAVREAWRDDIEGNVARAHSYWPDILSSYGPPRS